MRIAFFTETFLPRVDGVVNTLCYLLDHLARHNHQSILFAPSSDHLSYAATPVISFTGFPFPLYPEFNITPPKSDVRDHLVRFRPDIIHTLSPVSLGLAGLWYAHRLNKPVVASYHTDVPGFAEYYGLSFLRTPLWAALRLIHNQADLNLCPSVTTKLELEQQGFNRVKIWTRGVDTDRFSPDRQSWQWRMRLSANEPQKPLLLFVGRLSVEKRIEWLRDVLDSMPETRLAIVGDGPDRERLENLFAGQPVVFTGYLHGDDLSQAYASADIFTFPAANETLGNVILEAMASGLAVVAAGSGGPIDLIANHHNGLLFSSNDRRDMIAKIKYLLESPEAMRRLRQAGRNSAMNRSWASIFDKLIEEYKAVIGAYSRNSPNRRRYGANLSMFDA